MATAQASKTTITLKGSSKTVTEFFNIAVNNILYQRGIYPPESFEQKRYLELPVWVSKNTGLQAYFSSIMKQMHDWLETGMLQKLVLVIVNAISKEVVERWTFEIETNKDVLAKGSDAKVEHDAGKTRNEIQNIVRQICACVTFLPLLNDPCVFDMLVYTDKGSDVPSEWEESDARIMKGAQELKLRSFNTGVHQMNAMVSFKQADEEEDA